MSGLIDVHVVLLRPRWANNLGAVARVMKNFGLQRLTIVDSQIGSWADAWRMAVHAGDVLEAAQQTDDLQQAMAGANWIVGTSNAPPAAMSLLTPREVAEQSRERGAPTLLFGGEIHGLAPAELLRCHAAACIPTAADQSSLNLSHAVAVFAAELFVAHRDAAPATRAPTTDAMMLQRLEQALRELLETSAWQDASRPKNAIAALMQPFYRAGLTDDEVRCWLVALSKARQR